MTPLTKFSFRDIEIAREYVKKHAPAAATLCTEEIVEELCDNAKKVLEENIALKERLFQIEQEQDSDKHWETILAAKLDRAIKENNHKDYLEIVNSINNDIFIITIQRKFGQTPEQLRKSSDIRRLKAAKKITNLLRENRQMQAKLHELDQELRVLKSIKANAWEDIKTCEDVQRAIDIVNNLIRQHNQFVFQRQLNKLTNSVRESLHESYTRVSQWQSEARKLQQELSLLKQENMRKKVERSRFSKYRKKDRKIVHKKLFAR